MTFFIPPVFLFGNNANRFHNNEEEKSEYKTAAETEIKVENWRAKRIAELEEENKKLREENEILRCNKGGTPEKVGHEEFIQYLMGENKKQKEENELLKQCLDKLMFDADVVNVKIHGELGDYVYVRSDRQFKLNVKD